MQEPNVQTLTFLKEFTLANKYSIKMISEETIKVSKTASKLAVIYETARNAIEFGAEHLIRQGAIIRILKRRLFLNQTSKKVASLLIKELLWGRYLKEETIPVSKVNELVKIIDRYRFIFDQYLSLNSTGKKNTRFNEWLIGIASCEIEEHLFFDLLPQVLINYCFESLSKRIDIPESDLKTKSIQIYIATERCFSQNSETFISYKLLKTFYPEWFNKNFQPDIDSFNKLLNNHLYIEEQLNYPLKNQLKGIVSKMIPPFNLIRDIVLEYPDDFPGIAKDPETLKKVAEEILEEKYQTTRQKLNRASRRSIIYIFLTKMVIGLLLELPFDLFIGKPNFLALGINAVSPPLLIFLLNLEIKVPGDENSTKMIKIIENYFYNEQIGDKIMINVQKNRGKKEQIFNLIYFITYFLIFGGIITGLNALNFNPISIIIFLFFACVVSFFAYRVRSINKDYLAQGEEGENLTSSFIDIVFLPIIKVGQWLSTQISNFNVLSFVFDFIIEAPLKAFLEIMEDWIHFVRIKKEEIIS